MESLKIEYYPLMAEWVHSSVSNKFRLLYTIKIVVPAHEYNAK